ncbi:MAG: acyl-CoA thioester hydrolase/BAAT C-terminal domain-containing protein [Jatrophihabitans sp.]
MTDRPHAIRHTGLVLILTLVAACLTGCHGSARRSSATLSVTPASALVDVPLSTTLRGLPAGTLTTVAVSAVAANGTTWSSSAQFRADSNGAVSLDQPPLAGSYTTANPVGLYELMEPPPTSADTVFTFPAAGFDYQVQASVAGAVLATAIAHRQSPQAAGITGRDLRVPADGIYGELYLPVKTAARRPAVLLFGGSEGGLSGTVQAGLLAAHGYPTLALAYFGEPGLPSKLANIALEYFAKALTVLRAQPDVDSAHVLVFGVSRGGEAALLIGAHYPSLVNGVVAAVPSSVVNGGDVSGTEPAWTLAGRGLPFVRASEYYQPDPPGDQAAVIPVERIAGPVLLSCGGLDTEWPSCPYTAAINARLKAHHFAHPVTVLRYPGGGHFAGDLDGFGIFTTASIGDTGGTQEANKAAHDDGYRTLLAFLADQ